MNRTARNLISLAALTATLVCGTLTGCSKDNSTNDNSTNNQWGAETLTFQLNNSSVEFMMQKVEGGNCTLRRLLRQRALPLPLLLPRQRDSAQRPQRHRRLPHRSENKQR